mmetsp:Transcript_23769/g.63661  ORF Transcript_23769/g.63661 Transcript_23769/m.63661 type:complete len:1373 (+) Transcript_23769:74-4192(+)
MSSNSGMQCSAAGKPWVAVRVRPPSSEELAASVKNVVSTNASSVSVAVDDISTVSAYGEIDPAANPTYSFSSSRLGRTNGQEVSFAFDQCYDDSANQNDADAESQARLFRDLGMPLVEGGLRGFDACFVASGETGAGRTYTLLGSDTAPGMIWRVVSHLLETVQQVPELNLYFSAMEVSPCEHLRDLLRPLRSCSSTEGSKASMPEAVRSTPPLAVLEHPSLGTLISGLCEVSFASLSEFGELVRGSTRERALAAVSVGHCSPPHVLYTLRLRYANDDAAMMEGRGLSVWEAPAGAAAAGAVPVGAQLVFADVASGCMWTNGASATGSLRRHVHASESFCALQRAVLALGKGTTAQHLSSRGALLNSSTLNQLLKRPLLGNVQAMLLAAVSPAQSSREETLRTLSFASAFKRLPGGEQRRGLPDVEVVSQLQEHVRVLRQQFLAAGSPLARGADTLAAWERALLARTCVPDAESSTSADAVIAEVNAAYRRRGFLSEGAYEGLELGTLAGQGVPYLSNLSLDAQLCGVLVIPLSSATGVPITVGSCGDCTIQLQGVGIPLQLCEILVDHREEIFLRLFAPAQGQPIRCSINGRAVQQCGTVHLEDGDRVMFGWAHCFQVHIPGHDVRAGSTVSLVPQAQAVHAVQELSPEDSDSYSVLSLYVDDIRNKMSDDASSEFLSLLREACHLVDEANEITRDMRPDLETRFDIDFVWDIFRRPEDVLVVRAIQPLPGASVTAEADSEAKVVAFWTFEKLCERLVDMRSCYRSFLSHGTWEGAGNPMEDPWLEHTLSQARCHLRVRLATDQADFTCMCTVSGAVNSPKQTGNSIALAANTLASAHGAAASEGRSTLVCAPPSIRSRPASAERKQHLLRSTPSRTRPSAQHSAGTPASNRGDLRRHGGSRTSLGADSAGGPSPQRGTSNLSHNDATPCSGIQFGASSLRGHAGNSFDTANKAGGANNEMERLRRETSRQAAEIKRLRSELQRAEREKSLQVELNEGLKAQLLDKDELVATLRMLARERAGPEHHELPNQWTNETNLASAIPGARHSISSERTLVTCGSRPHVSHANDQLDDAGSALVGPPRSPRSPRSPRIRRREPGHVSTASLASSASGANLAPSGTQPGHVSGMVHASVGAWGAHSVGSGRSPARPSAPGAGAVGDPQQPIAPVGVVADPSCQALASGAGTSSSSSFSPNGGGAPPVTIATMEGIATMESIQTPGPQCKAHEGFASQAMSPHRLREQRLHVQPGGHAVGTHRSISPTLNGPHSPRSLRAGSLSAASLAGSMQPAVSQGHPVSMPVGPPVVTATAAAATVATPVPVMMPTTAVSLSGRRSLCGTPRLEIMTLASAQRGSTLTTSGGSMAVPTARTAGP